MLLAYGEGFGGGAACSEVSTANGFFGTAGGVSSVGEVASIGAVADSLGIVSWVLHPGQATCFPACRASIANALLQFEQRNVIRSMPTTHIDKSFQKGPLSLTQSSVGAN